MTGRLGRGGIRSVVGLTPRQAVASIERHEGRPMDHGMAVSLLYGIAASAARNDVRLFADDKDGG